MWEGKKKKKKEKSLLCVLWKVTEDLMESHFVFIWSASKVELLQSRAES